MNEALMKKHVKFAISLPKDHFEMIEKYRKSHQIERSTAVDMAISLWISYLEQENLIRSYQEGYRKKPESLKEIEALEKMAADAVNEEGLS